VTPFALNMLMGCSRPLSEADGILSTKLYSLNMNVDQINKEELSKLVGNAIEFQALDIPIVSNHILERNLPFDSYYWIQNVTIPVLDGLDDESITKAAEECVRRLQLARKKILELREEQVGPKMQVASTLRELKKTYFGRIVKHLKFAGSKKELKSCC